MNQSIEWKGFERCENQRENLLDFRLYIYHVKISINNVEDEYNIHTECKGKVIAKLGGGNSNVLFSPLPWEDSDFDSY